ncbi:MAG: TerC family protein [Ignavibacteriales bacterium]|nr:TerC family protein [Ignavibacteriales bacterium]
MDFLFQSETWIALLTLTTLEIVLGIDNIIFISILSGKLPAHQQQKARTLGLAVAMISRILLLFSLTWVMRLTFPLFTAMGNEISGRDLILIISGLFLLAKSTHEIHSKLEGASGSQKTSMVSSFAGIIIQISIIDIVFSLDSVITAIGMTNQLGVMVAAVIISVAVMMVSAKAISSFVEKHPTIKMLALSFLLLIGVTLIAEGFEQHISKGYIYFAMAFSVLVEMLNLRLRKVSAEPVKLHSQIS